MIYASILTVSNYGFSNVYIHNLTNYDRYLKHITLTLSLPFLNLPYTQNGVVGIGKVKKR
jgi:hypothetical protein